MECDGYRESLSANETQKRRECNLTMDGNENESGKRHGSERNEARTRCFRRLVELLGADAVSHRGLELWVYLMAENVGEEALASLVADKLRKVTAAKAPSSGQAVLQDLTAILGAENDVSRDSAKFGGI